MPSVLCHLCQQCYSHSQILHLPLTTFTICRFCYVSLIQRCNACMTTLEFTQRYIIQHFQRKITPYATELHLFFQNEIPLTYYTRNRSLPFLSSFRKLRSSLTRLIWHHQHRHTKHCIQCNAHLPDIKHEPTHTSPPSIQTCTQCNYELCQSCIIGCHECNTKICDIHARQCSLCLVYYCHECDLFDTCDCCYDAVCHACIQTLGRLFLCKRQNPKHIAFFHTHDTQHSLVQQLLLTYISE